MCDKSNYERVGKECADWDDPDMNELKPLLNNMDNPSLHEQVRRYHQDTRQRLFLAKWVVSATSAWLGMVLVILVCCGCGVMAISDNVLNVLLATTTVNVLGLAYIVLKGLFVRKENSHRLVK